MLYGMADNSINIPANRDGAMYNTFAGGNDYIFSGIGNEFAITPSSSSFLITLGTGEGIVGGRHITEVTENGANSMIQLDANDTGYVVLRMDLTQPAGSEAYLYATPTIAQQDLNNGGTIRDLVLYGYVTDASGVSSFVDMRSIQSTPYADAFVARGVVNDADSAIEQGAYNVESTALNIPVAFNGFLLVFRPIDSNILQFYTRSTITQKTLYMRKRASNAWGSWYSITFN